MKKYSLNFRNIIFIFSLILICSHISSQEILNSEIQRPKIGVVLSGGGAKGLAHIGVLKVLEELDLRPDYITGVSMGALVGGLYSMGYSSDELDSIANDIDWNESITDNLKYNQVSINVKNDYKDYQLQLTGNNINEVGLPIGVVDGRVISQILSGLSWRSIGTENFDDFPIPFRCIATDIISGKPIMFSSGNIARAMRASMAIPTAFTPVVIDTLLLVDGGIINNFPVKECFDMGADIVIGVYVGADGTAQVKDLNTMVKVLTRSSFLGTLNAKEKMKDVDILIMPDLQGAGIESFSKSKSIIKMGEESAREDDIYKMLKNLSDSLKQFPKQEKIKLFTINNDLIINEIIVNGLEYSKKEFVIGISQIEKNSVVNRETINDALNRLYGTLIFEKIDYQIISNGDKYDLILNVKEKDLVCLNASIYYDSFFGAGLIFNSSYKNLLMNSSKLDLFLDFSKSPRANLSYTILGGKRKRLFFTLGAYSQSTVIPNYYKITDTTEASVGRFRNNQIDLFTKFGISISKNSMLSFKASQTWNNLHLQGGMEEIYGINNVACNNISLEGAYILNTYDNPVFPTKGAKLNIIYKKKLNPIFSYNEDIGIFKHINNNNDVLIFDYKQYFRIGKRFSIIPQMTIGVMNNTPFYADKFFLGGTALNTRENTFTGVGVNPYDIATDNFLQIGGGFQLKLKDKWYIYMFSQFSMFINNSETLSDESTEIDGGYISGWGASVGYNSLIGPLKLIVTQNGYNSKFQYYLNIGFPF